VPVNLASNNEIDEAATGHPGSPAGNTGVFAVPGPDRMERHGGRLVEAQQGELTV
jgi:hypothetical protein